MPLNKILTLAGVFFVIGAISACCRTAAGPEELTFSELVSRAEKYNGENVTVEAYYFTGFEITALSGAVGPAPSGPWRIVPTGTLIWAAGGVGEDIFNRMYQQTDTPSGYTERLGLLRATGKFETGGKYGHLDAYSHRFTIDSAELLEWSPPGASPLNGKLSPTTTVPVWGTELNLAAAKEAARDFILNSATFKFDGIPGSLALSHDDPGMISAYRSWSFTFKFETAHPGHGDRTGQMLAQAITAHYATVLVNLETNAVVWAVCDDIWDMKGDRELGVYVSGVVIGGGDTTPPGLLDAPRTFSYLILSKQGLINMRYTSYPPSPAGDAARAKITLDFFSGEVRVGDRMEAYGRLDRSANALVVAEEGDYIRTYEVKADIIGAVIDIREPSPAELVFELLRSDGTYVTIRYLIQGQAPTSFYNASVRIGDYLRAVGTYEKNSNTLVVATEYDMLKSYDHNPVISGLVFE